MTLFSCTNGTKNAERMQTEGWSNELLSKAKNYWTTMHESSVVILANGKEIANWGLTDKKIKVSSIRKSLISALYGIYVEQDIIDLDKTLKELSINDSPDSLSEMEQSATLRMLMQARSGIYHSYVGGTPWMKKSQPERYSHDPGSFWYYNNWDFNTLGVIFEQETKTAIGVAFEEQIGEKIGLSDFAANDVYYLEDELSVHRQYHFRMTVRDIAKVGQLMLQNGQWNGTQIIPLEWIEESTKSYSDTHLGTGYGYMWWTANNGVLFEDVLLPENSYSAFGAMGKYLVIIPEYDLVIAHLQTAEWPDRASKLPKSEVPNRETDENDRKTMGKLIKLILEARIGKEQATTDKNALNTFYQNR